MQQDLLFRDEPVAVELEKLIGSVKEYSIGLGTTSRVMSCLWEGFPQFEELRHTHEQEAHLMVVNFSLLWNDKWGRVQLARSYLKDHQGERIFVCFIIK